MGYPVMETYTERPADLDGHMVCATLLPDGAPVYFYAALDAPDIEVAGLAFTARHGREPEPIDWEGLAIIERHRGSVHL